MKKIEDIKFYVSASGLLDWQEYFKRVSDDIKDFQYTICNKCNKHEVDIFHHRGNYCIDCWYELTNPVYNINHVYNIADWFRDNVESYFIQALQEE